MRLLRAPRNAGTGPESPQPERSSTNKLLIAPRKRGMAVPIGLLSARKYWTCLKPDNSSGNGPAKKLWLKSSKISLSNLPASAGILPAMLLQLRSSFWSRQSCPIEGGIPPCSPFQLRSMMVRLERPPISAGMEPVRLL